MSLPPSALGKGAETRARILDAAERIVLERGVGALTLDAVAEASNLSKGGLIYHFPSKEALITAMLGRLISVVEQRILGRRAADQEPGGWTRGYVTGCLPEADSPQDRLKMVGAALLAVVAADLSLLAPLREHMPVWIERLHGDGLDPITAMVIRLAVDGLWMNDLFRLEPVTPDERRAVIERLLEMTRS